MVSQRVGARRGGERGKMRASRFSGRLVLLGGRHRAVLGHRALAANDGPLTLLAPEVNALVP